MVKHQQVGWYLTGKDAEALISKYASIQERAQFEAQGATLLPMYAGGVRYCPECGHVGPVDPKHRDCCPDGSHAVTVPPEVAEQARAGFQLGK